jgi:hypothetical protein
MMTNYLLDEALPRWWLREMAIRGPELKISRVGSPGAPPLGALDLVLLEWCEAEHAFLLTNNRRSMPRHLADFVARGRHVPGIFQVDPMIDVAELIDELVLIAGAALENEYQDQIRYLPIT